MTDASAPPAKFADAFDQLHDVVAAQVGSSDFGPDDYHAGLRVLLQSMDYDPQFSEGGRRVAWSHVVDALAGRAIAFRAMAQTPGFDSRPITRPIIITGVPRTGTTALHKLLAVDPQFQGLEKWLTSSPIPRPPRETWRSNPYFQAEVARMDAHFGATPEHRAAHNMAAEEVDECLWIERQTFLSNYWPSSWPSATYDAWWQAQDCTPAYRYLYKTLQLIGSNDPDKRWLLKNPSHILYLDLLFATFPDAMVIQTHRDPAKAVPSLCALLMQLHPLMEDGRTQERAHNLGAREVSKYAKGVRDAQPVREAHRSQILDVVHADFHAEPMAVVRRIYDFAGLELTPQTEAAMAERIAAAPELSHGVHRYAATDFGLTEDEIRRRFGDYVDRFGLRPKTS